jgi:peroxiredoxin
MAMSRNRSFAVVIVVAAGIAGAALVAALGPSQDVSRDAPAVESSPRAVAAASSPSPPPAAALKPRSGRVLGLADALKELDLIKPSRQKLAEDFTLPLVAGRKFRLGAERGKVVMVNFWATWCPPCREEMPAMERLWRHQKDQGFVIVAVALDADPKVVKPFVDRYGLTFPVALDPKMDLGNTYGVRGLPSSFIVDKQGHLAALALGPRPWDSDAGQSLVEGLLR